MLSLLLCTCDFCSGYIHNFSLSQTLRNLTCAVPWYSFFFFFLLFLVYVCAWGWLSFFDLLFTVFIKFVKLSAIISSNIFSALSLTILSFGDSNCTDVRLFSKLVFKLCKQDQSSLCSRTNFPLLLKHYPFEYSMISNEL